MLVFILKFIIGAILVLFVFHYLYYMTTTLVSNTMQSEEAKYIKK